MTEPAMKNAMKKIILNIIFLSLIFHSHLQAQVTMTVNISYPAPTYLSDWSFTRSGMAVVTFTPAGVPAQLIKFETRILRTDGTVVAASNKASAIVYTLQRGPNTFTLDKILQLENLRFTDSKVIRSIQSSGKLPSGSYQLCVQVLNNFGEAVFQKSPVCRTFLQ